jgi:flagellar basal body L-ring protein FlgH
VAIAALGGCGSATGSQPSSTHPGRSTEAARTTLLRFFNHVQHGQYDEACAMYTPTVRSVVDRDFGGCERNLAGLHTLAQKQRAHNLPDVLSITIRRVRVASFSISGDTAMTTDLGRPGTTTQLLYRDGRWEINRPAT